MMRVLMNGFFPQGVRLRWVSSEFGMRLKCSGRALGHEDANEDTEIKLSELETTQLHENKKLLSYDICRERVQSL